MRSKSPPEKKRKQKELVETKILKVTLWQDLTIVAHFMKVVSLKPHGEI